MPPFSAGWKSMSLGKLTISPGFVMDFDAGLGGDIAPVVLNVDNETGEARQPARRGARRFSRGDARRMR
jgi:hypothetical protein